MAVNIVLGLVLVVFIIVVFVIAQCRSMHDIAPHGAIPIYVRYISLYEIVSVEISNLTQQNQNH